MNLQSAPRPGAMSRRRVSVKDLGEADCQGWLQRRKDGRSFLGGKWKRFWFVLKKSSLYWYCNKTAEKAEGFINLSGFSIEPARACRKKHVITASHPHVVTIFIAADSFADMNKWISRLRAAAEPNELVSAAECYSEDSDQDTDESGSASHSLDSELDQAEPEPVSKPSFSETCPALSSQAEDVPPPGCSSDPAAATRTRTSSASCSDLPASGDSSEAAGIPQLHVTEEREEKPSDEMEALYEQLKAASLSPVGQRDFRASFVRRSRNEAVNEKLQQLRVLSSTLKAKESELQLVEQILAHPDLPAATYRWWKVSNLLLLEDLLQPRRPAGGATELSAEAAED